MNIFLIDYENVHWHGLHGISRLKAKDKVIIFHSSESDVRDLSDILDAYRQKGVLVEFKPLTSKGKNHLDFMISVQIGWEAREKRYKKNIAVISKDAGYVSAMEYAVELNPDITVKRAVNIAGFYNEAPEPAVISVPASEPENRNEIPLSERTNMLKRKIEDILNNTSLSAKKRGLIVDALIKKKQKDQEKVFKMSTSEIKKKILMICKLKERAMFEDIASKIAKIVKES